MSDPKPGNTIDLILTDTRESVYKNVTKTKRVQRNINLNGILIDESAPGETYRRLLSRVKDEVGHNSQFIICNPDQDLISTVNVTLLRTGDSILVFDYQNQPFPFTFERTVNTTPHSRAVTSQEWSYHGNPEHNRAAFALGELVDNSLAATANNEGERIIEIRFYENGTNGAQSFIHVLDNGCGMNSETLNDALKYKALKVKREGDTRNFANVDIFPKYRDDPLDDIHPRYINSNISKFGAGMKACAFCIGRSLRVITKQAKTEIVHDVTYSKTDLERRESSHGREKPWYVPQKSRNPGEMPSESGKPKSLIKELIEEEIGKKSFTHTILSELNGGDDSSSLEFIRRGEKKGTTIERQLAHMYHYYIHGRDGVGSSVPIPPVRPKNRKSQPQTQPPPARVDIIVSRFTIKDNVAVLGSKINLRDIPPLSPLEDLESKFIRTAEDTFRFTIEVAQFSGISKSKPFKVGGIIRYHPYHFDGETHPEGLLTRKGSGTLMTGEDGDGEDESNDNDKDETEIGGNDDSVGLDVQVPSTSTSTSTPKTNDSGLGVPRKCKDFFYVWWNGRLIPLAKLESFDWCSPNSKVGPSHQLYKCYDRISGSLFFDSNVDEITDNKLFIANERLMHMFNEKRIGGHQATFQRITGPTSAKDKTLKAKRMGKKEFEDWLKECHRKYDKQVRYSGHLGTTRIKSKEYHIFQTAVWQTKLQIGDAVRCIRKKPHVIGLVKQFLVDGDVEVQDDEDTIAPLSLVQIVQVPQALFGDDELIIKCMAEIDTTTTVATVQASLNEMEEQLEMEFEFHDWYGQELKEGAEIPLDAILIKDLHIKIKRTVDQKEILGTLDHPAKNKAKKIYLIGRVYRIHENGRRETYVTTKLCQWNTAYKGFFFRAIDMRQSFITEPGDYGITFLSYVDVHEHHLKTNSKGSSSSGLRRTRSTNLTLAPYEIEEERDMDVENIENDNTREEGVDDIGRHALKCGNKLIPMPIHPGINFKVIAGTPHKFSIDNIGEEDAVEFQVGQPFDITLSFEDSKGNRTKPESCDGLVPIDPDKPLVFKAPGSKNTASGNVNIIFTHQDIVPDDERVIIRGVVARGVLGAEFIDCRVGVRLQWKSKKTETCTPCKVRFSIGVPAQIKIVEPSLEVENGTFPSMTCLLKDTCGNIITHHRNKKPIELICDIFRGKSLRSMRESKLHDSIKIKASGTEQKSQKFPSRINLEELKNGVEAKVSMICRVSLGDKCEYFATVSIKVIPSKRPESLRIYFGGVEEDGSPLVAPKELKPKSEVKLSVRTHLDDLIFKLYDGFGNEVHVDHKKYKIKFDWPKKVPGTPSMKMIMETGILPRLETPGGARSRRECFTTLVSEDPYESDLKIGHRFFLTTQPLDPSELKVNVKNHSIGERVAVKFDELANLDIVASILDKFNNPITDFKDDSPFFEMETENSESIIEFVPIPNDPELNKWGGSFILRQLRFLRGTPPVGDRDLIVKFGQNLKATLRLKLLPGKVTSLTFDIDGVPSLSSNKILNQTPVRVKVQLKDSFGNGVPSSGKSLTLSMSQKMIGYEGTAITNSEGVGDFKLVNIKVKPEEKPSICEGTCRSKCYNLHYLIAKFGELTSHCRLHILCRPDVPTKFEIHCGVPVCTAGCKFERFTATLLADDGSTVIRAKLEDLDLSMMSENQTKDIFHLKPDSVREGIYTFGTAPELAGWYHLEFSYKDGKTSFVQRHDERYRICSSIVSSLEPQIPLKNGGIICVSNDPDRGRRTVLPTLKLVLKDKYKNDVTEYLNDTDLENMDEFLNGKVKICVEGQSADGIKFLNHDEIFCSNIPLNFGVVFTPEIILRPDTDLPNNSKYTLKFTATLRNREIYTFNQEFTFYNDIFQQRRRQELEDSKANLEEQIQSRTDQFDMYNEELQNLKNEEAKVRANEEQLRIKFTTPNIDLSTESGIAQLENRLMDKQRGLERARRGTDSNVEQWDHSREQVLGVIGRLAQVKSEDGGVEADLKLQAVLSWHMQKYLPVVVALTTSKGLELEGRFKQKRFMLLDSLPEEKINWNEQIPIKLRGYGNPRYARTLLQFSTTADESKIQKLFNIILGRTIIIDTQADGANYRKDYLSGGYPGRCPTIITRDGRRIGGDAIIGGSGSHCPELGRLQYKFGLAPTEELTKIDTEVKGLAQLREALKMRLEAEKCREDYVKEHLERTEKLGDELTAFNTEKDDVEFELDQLNDEIRNYSGRQNDPDMEVTSTTAGMTPSPLRKFEEDEEHVVPLNKRLRRY